MTFPSNFNRNQSIFAHLDQIGNAPIKEKAHASLRLGLMGYLSWKISSIFSDNLLTKFSITALLTESGLHLTRELPEPSHNYIAAIASLWQVRNKLIHHSNDATFGVLLFFCIKQALTPIDPFSTQRQRPIVSYFTAPHNPNNPIRVPVGK